MFRSLHILALRAALVYLSTSLCSVVLDTMGKHPIPLPCSTGYANADSRKIVNIRDKIFHRIRRHEITVTLRSKSTEGDIAHYNPTRKTARVNVSSPRQVNNVEQGSKLPSKKR